MQVGWFLDKYWAAANQNQRKRFTEGLYQALIRFLFDLHVEL